MKTYLFKGIKVDFTCVFVIATTTIMKAINMNSKSFHVVLCQKNININLKNKEFIFFYIFVTFRI